MTKLSSSLPAGDANGLSALGRQLLQNPKGTHIVVGVIDVKTITTDVDTGDQVATVRFRRVEPIVPQDADDAVRLMQRGTERRTGATMLPIEMEDELRELMRNLDFSTGELTDDEPDAQTDDDAAAAAAADDAQLPVDADPIDDPDAGEATEQPPTPGPDPEPAETPAPADPPAEPVKKKRGRPAKAKPPAEPQAAPADLAAAEVAAAPWDSMTTTEEPETKED